MAETTGKLARWCLRLLEFGLNSVNRAEIKRQAAEALSRLKSKGEDKTTIDNEGPYLTVSQELFTSPPMTEATDLELIE